jgi:hypothetical protein
VLGKVFGGVVLRMVEKIMNAFVIDVKLRSCKTALN